MPIYEYCCEKCGEVFEEWQSNFEEREVPCPECSGNSKRIMSNTTFVLKGSGWYVTDYSGKNASFGAKGEESPKGKSNGNGNGNGSGNGTGDSSETSGSTSAGDSASASGGASSKDSAPKSEPATGSSTSNGSAGAAT